MPSVSLTFGGTVRSFPALVASRSKKVQNKIQAILKITAMEVVKRLEIKGKDYNDQTGTLRDSWRRRRIAKTRFRWRISNPTKYASYIEYGTYKIEARLMLHREIANGRARLRRRLKQLDKEVKRGKYV